MKGRGEGGRHEVNCPAVSFASVTSIRFGCADLSAMTKTSTVWGTVRFRHFANSSRC